MSKNQAVKLIKQLKISQGETDVVIHDKGTLDLLSKKPLIIRLNDDGTLDHKGNFRRMVGKFKKSYNFICDVMFPAVIGLALGSLFFTGPAYFTVIGVAVPVMLGLFIITKVLEHRGEKRMKNYGGKLAMVGLRDQVAEYQKLLDLEGEFSVKSTVVPLEQNWVKDFKTAPIHHLSRLFAHDLDELHNTRQSKPVGNSLGYDASKLPMGDGHQIGL